MNVDFVLKQVQSNIQIIGETNYKDYSQCITLNLLIDSNNNIKQSCVNTHSGLDESLFQNIEDGWYRVYHIIIPSEIPTDINKLYQFGRLYIYKDGYVYQYLINSESLKEIELTELLDDYNSNISSNYKDVFIYNQLETCIQSYILAANSDSKLEKTSVPECTECKQISDFEIKERIGYLNMLLEMIKHFIKCNNFSSAQEVLKLNKYCNVRVVDN